MTQEEKAKEYSFNIESQLFPTLNAEQQKMWKQEIEEAYMAGYGAITQDQIDALRMEYEKGRADAISHPTGGELLHVLNKGHKQGYKEATDKAFDWLIERYENQGVILLDDINELKQRMEKKV